MGATTYQPRATEGTVLHRLVRDYLETFLREVADRADGGGLPRFVEREFREFLTCGALSRGFARLRCEACAFERLVPFSCKRRGYAEGWNMRWRTTAAEAECAVRSPRTSHNRQALSDAISASGGRNFPGRSWGGVTDVRTPIRCVTSTRK